MEIPVFSALRKEICRTDGLVDETRPDLERWFDGTEYLQVLAQVYELTNKKHINIEQIQFQDVEKGTSVLIGPDRLVQVEELEEYNLGRKRKTALIFFDKDGNTQKLDRDIYQILKTPEGKFMALDIPTIPELFESNQSRLRNQFPLLVRHHLDKAEKVQHFIPEELKVINNIRTKCQAVLQDMEGAEDIIKQPSYQEHEKVKALLTELQKTGRKITTDEIDQVLAAFAGEKRELVSYGVFKMDMHAETADKKEISKFFLKKPDKIVAQSNGRQLVRHYADEYRKGCLELITNDELPQLHSHVLQEIFDVKFTQHTYSKVSNVPGDELLLRRMFAGTYAHIEKIIIPGNLSPAERAKINKSLFASKPGLGRKGQERWPREDIDQAIQVSKKNAFKAILDLISERKRAAEQKGETFFPALLGNDEINSISRTTLYLLFGIPRGFAGELFMKIIPDLYQETSEKIADYYLKADSRTKADLATVYLNPGNYPHLSEEENEAIRERSIKFSKLLIRRYKFHFLGDLPLEEFPKDKLLSISPKNLGNLYGLKQTVKGRLLLLMFPDDFGVLTHEKWERYKNKSTLITGEFARIFFGKTPFEDFPDNLKIKHEQRIAENAKKALLYLEEDEKKPIFAFTKNEITDHIMAIETILRDKGESFFEVLNRLLGQDYRKLKPHTVDWVLQKKREEEDSESRNETVNRMFAYDPPAYLSDKEKRLFLNISKSNARLVIKRFLELENKDLEEFEHVDMSLLGNTICKLFGVNTRHHQIALFRMFPEEYGRLTEKKSALLSSHLGGKLPFLNDSLMWMHKEDSILSEQEQQKWLDISQRNWLIHVLFLLYNNADSIFTISSRKLDSLLNHRMQTTSVNVFQMSSKGHSYSETYKLFHEAITQRYDYDSQDDYRQFFWRNIIKFCGNPRTFFDVEKAGIGRFNECLEVLPPVWLNIMQQILEEKIEGQKEDKPVQEAVPLQEQAVSAMREALAKNNLGQASPAAWNMLNTATAHPAVTVQEKAWQSLIELRENMDPAEKEQFKQTICRRDRELDLATEAIKELGAKPHLFWDKLQREINTDFRQLLEQTCPDMPEFTLENNYALLPWRQERDAYQQIALDYCRQVEKELTDNPNLDIHFRTLKDLHDTNFPATQEKIIPIIEKYLPTLEKEEDKMEVTDMLPSLITSKDKILHQAGMNMANVLVAKMQTGAGIQKLKKIIETVSKQTP